MGDIHCIRDPFFDLFSFFAKARLFLFSLYFPFFLPWFYNESLWVSLYVLMQSLYTVSTIGNVAL